MTIATACVSNAESHSAIPRGFTLLDVYYAHLTNSTHCDFNETPWFDSPTSTTLIRRALVQDL